MYKPYRLHLLMYIIFIIVGFLNEKPIEILLGIKRIIFSEDILITDYVELASLGSTLVNVGLVGIFCVLILYFAKIKPNGSLIMALWLTTGFAFFGKNIYNMWPPMIGVFLYTRVNKFPFSNYSLVCLLSTSLAPIVSQASYIGITNKFLYTTLGIVFGIAAGYILPVISSFTVRVHGGYNLYNVGFASGLIGTLYASLGKAFGIKIENTLIWGTDFNKFFTIFLIIISLLLIAVGFYCSGKESIPRLKKIIKHPGRLVTDFYFMYGESTYINMGILGLFSCFLLHIIGADINGPTVGGVFTIIGFGAFGKHIFNIVPVMTGAILSAFLNIYDFSSPSITLAILFSTCLAPIAGQFGPVWGIIAGFIHVAMVSNIGGLHSGLNLYSNGYAGGFVALILVPIMMSFRSGKNDEF